MKKLTGSLITAAAVIVLCSGCVPIMYTKTVAVTRDANGNVTSTVTTESITEPHQETPKIKPLTDTVTLDHLK